MLDQLSAQPCPDLVEFDRTCQVAQLGHRQPRIAAGVDSAEWRKVHVHVQGKAVERTAVANSQAEGGDFRSIDIDARGVGLGRSLHVVTGEQLDQRLLDTADQLAHPKAQPAHIQQ